MFIEILLLILSGIAILGLASFVRLRTAEVAATPSPVDAVSSEIRKMDTLGVATATGDSDEPTVPESQSTNSTPSSPSQLRESTPDPDPSLPFIPSGPVTLPTPIVPLPQVTITCDESKKATLILNYNRKVSEEEVRHKKALALVPTLLRIPQELLIKHSAILDELKSTLVADLVKINCSL